MASASSVVVPNQFLCPITSELMIEPVKTDCNGLTNTNIFKRIYYALFSKSGFRGHVFENLALASWLTSHFSCPVCRQTITKVKSDKETEQEIKEQFISVSEANRVYFANIKKELDEDPDYSHVRGNNFLARQDVFEDVKEYLKRFSSRPIETFNETFNVESVITSYLRDDDLESAERIVDRGFSLDLYDIRKRFFLKKIIKAYIDRPYSDANLQNAIRIIHKITWNNSTFPLREKNALLETIYSKYITFDNLQRAEYVANRLDDNFFESRKNIYLKKIIKAYINRPYSDSNLQNAIRIIYQINWMDSRVPSPEKNELLKTILRKYINFDNLQRAESVADKLSNITNNLQEYYFNTIVYAYVNRSYLDSNLKEAKRIVSTKVRLSKNRDDILDRIAIKYSENGKYKEAYQTLKIISNTYLKLIAYVFISTTISRQITKKKVANITLAIKNFVNRVRSWLKTRLRR